MKTVLAPIDFSPITDRVVAEAIVLARAMGARLVLFHVVTTPPAIGPTPALMDAGAEIVSTADRAAALRLGKLQRTLRDEGVTAHAVHVTGDARTEIPAQAERLAADYIVLGSHGRTAIYDVLVGSTATGVLKLATCRVVIVPADARPVEIAT